jgi:hypothetical protein
MVTMSYFHQITGVEGLTRINKDKLRKRRVLEVPSKEMCTPNMKGFIFFMIEVNFNSKSKLIGQPRNCKPAPHHYQCIMFLLTDE